MALQPLVIRLSGLGHNAPDGAPPPTRGGLQAQARAARYQALAALATDAGLGPDIDVFTAHHADDQLETMALRLAAASGWAGLAGMREQQAVRVATLRRPLRLVRPLLNVRKATLQAACAAEGTRWAEDPSNAKLAYARNRSRAALRELASQDPALEASLLELQSDLQATRRKMEAAAEALLEEAVVADGAMAGLWLDRRRLVLVPPTTHRGVCTGDAAVQTEAVRRILAAASGRPLQQPDAVRQACRFLREGRGGDSAAFGGCQLVLLGQRRGNGCIAAALRQPLDRLQAQRAVADAARVACSPLYRGGLWWDGRLWLAGNGDRMQTAAPGLGVATGADAAPARPEHVPPRIWRLALGSLPSECGPGDAVAAGGGWEWEPAPHTVTWEGAAMQSCPAEWLEMRLSRPWV
jgi:hypothetical protein